MDVNIIKELIFAACNDDVQRLRKLLKFNKPDLNETIMGSLRKSGRHDLISMLEDLNEDALTMPALVIAAENGFVKIAKILIANGADLDVKDHEDMTPLMKAAQFGYLDMVNLLLDSGAKINEIDDAGWTALILAIEKGYSEIAEVLVKSGADIWQKRKGMTSFDVAVMHRNPVIVRLIYEEYVSQKKQANEPYVDLEFALESSMTKIRCKLNGKASEDELFKAAKQGEVTKVQYLLDSGADVSFRDENGKSAMSIAAENGHEDVVKFLIKNHHQDYVRRAAERLMGRSI